MLGGKKSLNQNSSNFQPRKPWGFSLFVFSFEIPKKIARLRFDHHGFLVQNS